MVCGTFSASRIQRERRNSMNSSLKQFALVAVVSVWTGSVGLAAASITGKVSLPHSAPPPPPTTRYAGQVGEIAPPDPPSAVVYLEGKFPITATNTTHTTNEMVQEGMQFHPALLPIQVGTAVVFPNEDPFYHNVFSYSKPKRFDLGRYRREDNPAVQVFDKPGVVKLFCEIHSHMRGIILVLDTPYFTRTETNGVYQLQNLPAGNYVLTAWIDENHVYHKPVTLSDGSALQVDFDQASSK
jgi:plastocyanin